jgi:hypothetical protein
MRRFSLIFKVLFELCPSHRSADKKNIISSKNSQFATDNIAAYIKISSNIFRRLRRRKQAPVICGSPASGLAAFFDNFKFFFGGKFNL